MVESSFDAVGVVRQIVRSAATAALGTLTFETEPFVTLVTVATDVDASPVVMISALAAHSRNLARDSRASLLMQAPADEGDDPLMAPRMTVVGRFLPIAPDDPIHQRLAARFLARHPKAKAYAGFGDFSVHRMEMESVHVVAGFGRIARLSAEDILVAPAVADAFVSADAALREMVNGTAPGLRVAAIDPDGLDLAPSGRVFFPRRATGPDEVAALIADLN